MAETYRPFNIAVAGVYQGQNSGMSITSNKLSSAFRAVREENGETEYLHEALGLKAIVTSERRPGAELQRVTVVNCGGETQTITHLSAYHAISMDFDRDEVAAHWFANTWEGEYQYRTTTFREHGITRISSHRVSKSFSLTSVGSFTTANYMPFLTLENRTTGGRCMANILTEGNWRLEASYGDEGAYIDAAYIDERYLGSVVTLAPGESFVGSDVLCSTAEGDFAGALRDMTRAKRSLSGGKGFPLVFNDYMNCLWGQPTRAKLLPLIDAAAQVGAEVFCIDAGWYGETGKSWGDSLGDWNDSGTLFEEDGLKGIFDRIREKGMLPGIWFEMEVCGKEAELFGRDESWFLHRNGKRLGADSRYFLNFENPEVRDYLFGKVGRYYDMGMRFIKNDYNECMGNGGAELVRHSRFVRSFYAELKRRFPELLIENCGSGAMRCDYSFLRVFDIQSTSDQEYYYNYPSIVQGALANMPPEKAGIWAYPYPHEINRYFTNAAVDTSSYSAEETVFNMVSGLAGVMYLSGRIDLADAENRALLREAADLYKELRDRTANAVPVYPTGFAQMAEQDRFVTLGLVSQDNTMLLYVWRLGSEGDSVHLNLKAERIEQIYPRKGFGADCTPTEEGLDIRFAHKYSARLFEVTLR